ncbi:MAG: CBS domain-containing protein [Pseudomonadota bacterium]
MKRAKVKEFMVPLSEYATVSEEATLEQAVKALKKTQKEFDQNRYRHRAILVYDENRQIVSKLSQHDVIKALEPQYRKIKDLEALDRFGFDPVLVESMLEQYHLWDNPIEQLCKNAANQKVKEIMYSPKQGEYISEDATMSAAIHQLVAGRHHSLLVMGEDEIVGILRLTDVFALVTEKMEEQSGQ